MKNKKYIVFNIVFIIINTDMSTKPLMNAISQYNKIIKNMDDDKNELFNVSIKTVMPYGIAYDDLRYNLNYNLFLKPYEIVMEIKKNFIKVKEFYEVHKNNMNECLLLEIIKATGIKRSTIISCIKVGALSTMLSGFFCAIKMYGETYFAQIINIDNVVYYGNEKINTQSSLVMVNYYDGSIWNIKRIQLYKILDPPPTLINCESKHPMWNNCFDNKLFENMLLIGHNNKKIVENFIKSLEKF